MVSLFLKISDERVYWHEITDFQFSNCYAVFKVLTGLILQQTFLLLLSRIRC
jgi:hypothetical protein